jgi:PKD repeat protein
MISLDSIRVNCFAWLTVATLSVSFAAEEAQGQHHVPGRDDPYNNCQMCHGYDLQGGIGRSCYGCHGRLWPGGEEPPIADPGGPYSGEAGTAVHFDGSGSYDVDGAIVAYSWDFGDGETGTGSQLEHAYASAGSYSVSLTVTDDNGLTDTSMTTAEVSSSSSNEAPTAVAGGPYTANVGSAVQFDGSGSLDIDGEIISYLWTFGDGETGFGETATHTYSSAGIYTVQLTVMDDGGLTDTATTVANISNTGNSPPVADAGGPYSGAIDEEIQFDASATYDPDGDTLIYLWDFGDGSTSPLPSQSPLAAHAYSEAGTYTVQLAVSDGANMPVIVETTVEVTGDSQPPDSSLYGTWEVRIPLQQVSLTVTFQDWMGFLMVLTTHADGSESLGMGFAVDNNVLWMDVSGPMFFGALDAETDTMMGILSNPSAGNSVWFAEKLP